MNDKELYNQLLLIHMPWNVSEVKLDLANREVTVLVEYAQDMPPQCPECNRSITVYDHVDRRWRHLDSCHCKTYVTAKVPRGNCPTHGVKQVKVPWAEEKSRYTALFEAQVILWLQETNIKAVSKMFRMSWTAVSGIMERAVERGMARRKQTPIEQLGVDETSYQKRHEYVTVLVDREEDKVVDILDDRKAEGLDAWFKTREKKELERIKSISMDMWDPYIKAVTNNVPGAEEKICFDRFHVAQHLGKGLDKVRAEEHAKLQRNGRESCLTKTRFQWLKNSSRIDNRSRLEFMELTRRNLKTSRAWAIKETASQLWHYTYPEAARKAWMQLCGWISKCRLAAMISVGRMIRQYLWGILNAVIAKVNNSMLEAKNARIQKIKSQACGFRNRKRFKMAIMFNLGKLDLMPTNISGLLYSTL